MKPLRALLGAQFCTSLADNALLIVAIGLLVERAAPAWMTPALRICLYLAYVVLAPFVGAALSQPMGADYAMVRQLAVAPSQRGRGLAGLLGGRGFFGRGGFVGLGCFVSRRSVGLPCRRLACRCAATGRS